MTRITRLARVPLALGAFLVAGGCAPTAEGPSQQQVENEIAARTLMSLWGAADAQALAGLFHPDALYDDFTNQIQHRGLEEIAAYVNHVYDWSSAVDLSPLAVHAWEGGATVEWVLTAIQDRPIGTRLPTATGREVVLNGVTILEMEGGRIRRAADYVDALPMMLQLGGEIRLPGGAVVRQDAPPPVDEEAMGSGGNR